MAISLNTKIDLPHGGSAFSGGIQADSPKGILQELAKPFQRLAAWVSGRSASSTQVKTEKAKDSGKAEFRLVRQGRAGHVKLEVLGQKLEPSRKVAVGGSAPKTASSPTGVGHATTTASRTTGEALGARTKQLDATMAKIGTLASEVAKTKADLRAELILSRSASPIQAKIAELNRKLGPMPLADTPENRKLAGQIADQQALLKKVLADPPQTERGRNLHSKLKLEQAKLDTAIAKGLDEHRIASKLATADGADKTVTDKLAGQWRQLSAAIVGVHLPAIASLTASVDQAGDLNGDAWRLALTQSTGLSEPELRQRFDAGRLRDDSPSYQLVGDPLRFLATIENDLKALDQKGLLKPELLRRMSELGPMPDWSQPVDSGAGAAAKQARARDNLSAMAVFGDLLHGVARGNHDVIDTLMSGDRGLDEYAGKLKRLAAEQGSPSPTAKKLIEDRAKVQHELSRVKRDLGELLTLKNSAWFGKRVINVGGEGQLKIDAKLLSALREASADRAKFTDMRANDAHGRDVNLLIAHAMLLEKKLGALDAQIDPDSTPVGQRDAALATAGRTLAALGADAPGRQLLAALRGSADPIADLAPTGRLGRLMPLVAEHASLTAERAALQAIEQECTAQLMAPQPGDDTDAIGKRLVDAGMDLFANAEATVETMRLIKEHLDNSVAEADVQALAPLAKQVGKYAELATKATTADGQALADQRLGLDDRDLQKMGFKPDEIVALKADMNGKYPEILGGLASTGLKRSEDIATVTDEINAIRRRVIQGGMSQDAMKDFSKEVPEVRAHRLLDLVYQDVTGEVRKFGMRAGDVGQVPTDGSTPPKHPNAFGAKIDAFKSAPAHDALRFAAAGTEADQHSVDLARLATTLSGLESGKVTAQTRLGELAQQNGLKIDPKNPQGLQMSLALLDAVATEQLLTAFEAQHPDLTALTPGEAQVHGDLTGKLNDDFEKLKHFNRSNFQSSRVFGEGIRSRDELRAFATDNNIEVARLIKGIRETPAQITLAKAQIVEKSTSRDALLAERRTAMQAGAGRSDVQLRNAIRAAVVEVKLGEKGADFDPVAKRPEVEAQLRSWGIDPDAFRPEVEDVLFGNFDSAELERWIDDAAEDLSSKAHRDFQRPPLLARAGQALLTHLTDQRVVDGGTRHVMIDTIKSLQPGQSISLEQGDGVFLATGAVPVDPTGTLRARAEVAAGERKLLQVARTEEGYELFFKTGSKGKATLGASLAVFNVVNVGVAATGGGSRISGAGLLFKKEADLTEFLTKLTSGNPVRPGDWVKADQAVLVTDRTLEGGVEATISASTQSIGNQVPWVKDHLVFDKTFFGHLDGEIYAGIEGKAGAKRSDRWVEATNLGKTVKEHEVTVEGELGLSIGAYIALPTAGDAVLDSVMEKHGATDQLDKAFGSIPDWMGMKPHQQHDTNNATLSSTDEHLLNPFGSTTSGPLGIGVSAKHEHGKVTRLAFMASTNQLASEGNEIVKTYTATGKLGLRDLHRVKPTFTSAEEQAGAKDGLREAFDKDLAFRADAEKLLASASAGDKLSVTYVLKDEVRTVVNDLMRDAARHRERAGAHERAGQSMLAQHENKMAAEMEDRARDLYGRQSSFTADKVELVKSTQSQNDINVLGIGQAKWTRYSDGAFERPAITLSIPGGPSAHEASEKAEKASDKAVLSGAPSGSPPPTLSTVTTPPPSSSTVPPTVLDNGPGQAPLPETLLSTPDVGALMAQRLASPGATPDAVPTGHAFFVERQEAARCGLHALNGMLGGSVVHARELDAFIKLRLTEQATDFDARRALARQGSVTDGGIDLDVAKMFLNYLSEQAKLPYQFEDEVLWAPQGGAIDPRARLAPITGDAIEVEILSDAKDGSSAGYNHFVAFRQDEAGQWRLLDSLNHNASGTDQAIRGTPEDWIRDKLQNFNVKKVGILQKVPKPEQQDAGPQPSSRPRTGSVGLGDVRPPGSVPLRPRALSQGEIRPVTIELPKKEPEKVVAKEPETVPEKGPTLPLDPPKGDLPPLHSVSPGGSPKSEELPPTIDVEHAQLTQQVPLTEETPPIPSSSGEGDSDQSELPPVINVADLMRQQGDGANVKV